MKVIHRFVFHMNAAHRAALQALDVRVAVGRGLAGEDQATLHSSFEIAEDAPNWTPVVGLLRQWDADFDYRVSESSLVRTEYSKREMRSADWLSIAAWHHGYPQPDGCFEFRSLSYEPTESCDQCGVGLRQVAPFRMTGEPKWGRRGIMQLHWIRDEIFVKPEVWAAVFRPARVLCRPVVNRRGVDLKTVVQLVIEEEASVVTNGLPTEQCEKCGDVRPNYPNRGFFPMMRGRPSQSMARTREHFGSGAQSYKCLLLCHDLFRAIEDQGVRGAYYRPVMPNPDVA